jgi:alpha-N-acetylglucosaminidase
MLGRLLPVSTRLLLTALLVACADATNTTLPVPPTPPHDAILSTTGLIERLLGARYVAVFKLSTIPPDPATGQDAFEIDVPPAAPYAVTIRGNNGVSLASGLSWYLRYFLNCSISWGRDGSGNQLTTVPSDPSLFPRPTSKLRQVTPNTFRYLYNVCTFGYSTVWWGWEQWQEELDRMAVNGVNAPLAFVGTEFVLLQFFTSLGISQDELLNDWFTGPAFLPWNRMNNAKNWGGPLTLDWINRQRDLQLQILERMRSFGMAPILPGWSGRVPAGITKVFPKINVFALPSWAGFNSTYSSSLNIDPLDPLFVSLGVNYTRLLAQTYGLSGTPNVYQADLFNEMDPPSTNLTYLQQANAAMVSSITGADPAGIYMMQGWLFRFSDFWKGDEGYQRAQAFIGGLPLNNSIVLDLNTDQYPVWNQYTSFFGRAWIWNSLAVFGGRRGLYGNLSRISSGPVEDRNASSSMVGFGATPEAIEEIPLFFDLVWEMNWRSEAPPDLDQWIVSYGQRRYAWQPDGGEPDALLPQAMTTLRQAVYSSSNMDETPLENSPSFTAFSSRNTNATGLLVALRLFLMSALNKEVGSTLSTWQYDCVDLARQVLVNTWDDYHHYQALAYQPFITFGADTSPDVIPLTALMLNITSDLDRLLATNENYLLGNWIADARAWANNTGDAADLLELNARNQLTLWGPAAPLNSSYSNSIDDYAAKHWQGLVGGYSQSRWQLQSQYVLSSLQSRQPANWEQYQEDHLALEQSFTYTTVSTVSYPTQPSGESCLDVASSVLTKYAPSPVSKNPNSGDFVAYQNTDSASGYDIFQTWNTDTSFLMSLCAAAPSCGGFNSNGWLKPYGTLNWLKPMNGSTLWVKKSQVNQIKGILPITSEQADAAAPLVGRERVASNRVPGLLAQHCDRDDIDGCLQKANANRFEQGLAPLQSLELQEAMPF